MTTNIFERQMTWLSRVTLPHAEQNGENMCTTTIGNFMSPDYQRNFARQINRIRDLCPTLEDKILHEDTVKALKMSLPAGIISGIAEGGIGQDNIVRRNGIICVDIDAKDNRSIHDWEALKKVVGKLPFVGYTGLSVTGLGIFALIPVRDPEKHKEHFEALVRFFADLSLCLPQQGDAEATILQGLVLDSAPSNIASKRFISYDPSPVWKTVAEVYEDIVEVRPHVGSSSAGNRPLEPRPGMLRQMLQQLMSPLTFNDLPPFDLEGFLRDHAIDYTARPRQGGTQYIVRCPWAHLHSSHSYADSAIFRYEDGRIGYKCQHAHCADKTWHDYREFYENQ